MSQIVSVAPDFSGIAGGWHVRASHAVDRAGRWTVTQVSHLDGGRSGFTHLVPTAEPDRRLVVRLSPPNARIVGPNEVGRQSRIMAAMPKVGIPVPLAELDRWTAWLPCSAASCLKYVVILAYNYELHRRGKRLDPVHDALQTTTRGLVEGAVSLPDAA